RSAAAFVNAVLRKLSLNPSLPALENRTDRSSKLSSRAEGVGGRSEPAHAVEGPWAGLASFSPQVLAASSAHPAWLVERWIKHYGPEAARKICEHNQSIPATALRLRTQHAESELASQGISLEPGRLLSSARIVAD